MKLFLLITLMVFNFAMAEQDNKKFAGLKAECRNGERYAEVHEEVNAATMMGYLLSRLEEQEKIRKDKGKKLDILVVARAGLNTKKFNLISNEHPLEQIIKPIKNAILNEFEEKNCKNNSRCNKHRIETALRRLVVSELEDNYSLNGEDKEMLAYTHVGLLVRDKKALNGWSFIHLLTPCGKGKVIEDHNGEIRTSKTAKNVSRIYYDGIAQFYLDEPSEFKTWLMIPTDNIQDLLIETISKTLVTYEKEKVAQWKLKPPYYNIAANLKRVEEGNSNFWPLFTLTAAILGKPSITFEQAFEATKNLGYKPSYIQFGGIYSLASLFDTFIPSLRLNSLEQPFLPYNVIEMVTAQSIYDYMKVNGVLDDSFEVIVPESDIMKE